MNFKTRILRKLENFTRKNLFYTPYYDRVTEILSGEPEVFNKSGEKMNVFFLADREFAHNPYSSVWGLTPHYILWDRYNFGLKTHFYSHFEAFNTVGNPDRRFAILIESRGITPKSYKKFIRNKKYIENEFEAVFTFEDEILENISNAKFVPFCAGFWYGKRDKSVEISADRWKSKNKNISILSSDKEMCELHKVRKNLALKCKRDGLADTFGTFDGGNFVNPEETLKNYRFSIILENDISKFFFTEKLTNCFASQTIPIYLGAQKIDEFFNPDGIIKISLKDIDSIEKILAQCTPEEYERRLPAVIENFERVKNYENVFDYMYKKYFA